MPTLFTRTRDTFVTCTGNVLTTSTDRGTRITYTGLLTLNGRPVTSPKALRAAWASLAENSLEDGDRTERGDQREHFTARGRIAAYGIGVMALDNTSNPQDALEYFRAAERAGLETARTETGGDFHHFFVEALERTSSTLAAQLEQTAAYEWLED